MRSKHIGECHALMHQLQRIVIRIFAQRSVSSVFYVFLCFHYVFICCIYSHDPQLCITWFISSPTSAIQTTTFTPPSDYRVWIYRSNCSSMATWTLTSITTTSIYPYKNGTRVFGDLVIGNNTYRMYLIIGMRHHNRRDYYVRLTRRCHMWMNRVIFIPHRICSFLNFKQIMWCTIH